MMMKLQLTLTMLFLAETPLRVMTTNKFTGKKENEKDPQAKKFREADPGKVWEGAIMVNNNVYRGTLTSDFLAGATLYRYNGTNWEKTETTSARNER